MSVELRGLEEIFSKIPTDRRVIKIDDPPDEIKGSGIPFVGRSPNTTLILTNAWIMIISTIPNPTNVPNTVLDRSEILIPFQKNTKNKTTNRVDPISPSSSLKIEKIKSLWASGRKASFCLL